MEGFTDPSEADREFDELRARAYGPHPDIDVDPAALARLRELEAAHRPGARRRADAPPSESAAPTDAPPSENAARTDAVPTAAPADGAPADGSSEGDAPAPAGSAAAAPSPPAKEDSSRSRSLVQRATATWPRRLALMAGALVVVGGIITAVVLASAPRSGTTLRPTASISLRPTEAQADNQVRELVAVEASDLRIDPSTLRAYGSYLGLEIWSGVNEYDSPCLVALLRARDTLSEGRCTPPTAELIMDVSSSGDEFEGFEGIPGVGIIRFMLRGDTVDGYVYLVPEAD